MLKKDLRRICLEENASFLEDYISDLYCVMNEIKLDKNVMGIINSFIGNQLTDAINEIIPELIDNKKFEMIDYLLEKDNIILPHPPLTRK